MPLGDLMVSARALNIICIFKVVVLCLSDSFKFVNVVSTISTYGHVVNCGE